MLSLGCILTSDLVVANLFMYSLPGMILLLLGHNFFTSKVFLHEINYTNLFTIRDAINIVTSPVCFTIILTS